MEQEGAGRERFGLVPRHLHGGGNSSGLRLDFFGGPRLSWRPITWTIRRPPNCFAPCPRVGAGQSAAKRGERATRPRVVSVIAGQKLPKEEKCTYLAMVYCREI